MSRTLAHSPAARTDDGPRRAPRRPRYADQRAAERQDVRRIADAVLSGRTIADIFSDDIQD